jgi:hypothetical protein
MKTKWILLTTLTLLAALLLSGTAFAQGTVPQVPAAEVPDTTPAEVPPALPDLPVVVVVEAAPAAVVPVIEEALPDAAPTAEPVAAEAAVPVVVEEPQVALVDAQGEPMDMASQASADIIAGSDPRWKVGAQWYSVVNNVANCYTGTSTGAGTCFVYPGESDLISHSLFRIGDSGLLPTDRKLYVEAGVYVDNVTISSSPMTQMKGLIGVDGSADTHIFGNVNISHTVSGFTLSGFTINGYVGLDSNTGPLVLQDLEQRNSTGTGIYVNNHSGTITVKNVKTNNNDDGAYLENTAGGNISVSDSIFNNNNGFGLYIKTNGTTTLNYVIARDNQTDNIYLDGNTNVTLKNIIANDSKTGSGLKIYSHSGTLTIENFTASGNSYDGINAELNAPVTVTIKNLTANKNGQNGLCLETERAVTITNSQTNGNVADNGLYIETSGKIVLNTIRSSDNGAGGLKVFGINTWGPPGVIAVASPASVAITSPKNAAQSNVFDGNGEHGILISTDKPVSISNFSASGNDYGGVRIYGYAYYKVNPVSGLYEHVVMVSGATTITSTIPNYTNNINNNLDAGVFVLSSGNVKLERTFANGNTLCGIEINTLDTITVANIKANGNGAEAVKLFNKDALSAKAVTVTNVETSDNTGEKGRGLDIESRGIVKVTNLKSLNNSELGLNINNTAGGLGTAGLTLTNLTLNDNAGAGAELYSHGIVSLKTVTANNNGGNGVMIENDSTPSAKILLTSVRADGNNGAGFSLYTTGTLVVKDASAINNAKTVGESIWAGTVQDYYNASFGVDRWYFTAEPASVTTVRMEAGGTYPDGSPIYAYGLVPFFELYDDSDTLISTTPLTCGTDTGDYCEFSFTATTGDTYYVLASSTGLDGFYRLAVNDPAPFTGDAELYWAHGMDISATGNVTISGVNTFNNNSMSGLKMWVDGSGASKISVSSVTANGNGNDGMTLYNINGTGSVALSGNNETQNNGWGGLYVETNGTVSASNLDASYNGHTQEGDGVSITANGIGKAVTLTHITTLANSNRGLGILSNGNISLSNMRAIDNIDRGIFAKNCSEDVPGLCTGTGNFVLKGFNETSHNSIAGLEVVSNGKVTLSNLEASYNDGGKGVNILSYGLNKAVALNFVSAMGNYGSGLYIRSNGLTTLNTVRAWLNTLDGANIISEGYPIVVKFSSFIANDRSGLVYGSYPAPFTFTNLSNIFLGNGLSDLQPIP